MDEDTPQEIRQKPLNSLVVLFLLIILAAGIFLFLLRNNKTSNSSESKVQSVITPSEAMKLSPIPTSTNAKPSSGSAVPSGAAKVMSFTVHAKNYSFTPTTLSVKKGDSVSITFVNDEGFHDLVVDGYNVKAATIPAGKSETVTFVADKAGTFTYYCSVLNHRAMGMQGTLTVQ